MSTPEAELNTAASAAMMLARWWTRPLATEIAAWADAAELSTVVQRQFDDGGDDAPKVPVFSTDDEAAMLAEYERLFVGPGPVPCPPYESFWRTDVASYQRHSLMGPCVADLSQLYRTIGIGIDPEAEELPDHIAVEFEALGYALSLTDDQGVAKRLLDSHLCIWVPQFCRSVLEASRLPFFGQLAALTVHWLARIQSQQA